MGCYLGKMFCKMFSVLQLPCCLCKGNSLKLVYPSSSPVMCENLPFTSKHKFRSGQARSGQNGTHVFKSTGGFGNVMCHPVIWITQARRAENNFMIFPCPPAKCSSSVRTYGLVSSASVLGAVKSANLISTFHIC